MKPIELEYSNYKSVENCTVIDENQNYLFVGNRKNILTLTTDDGQNSVTFVEFDNNTTIQHDDRGCFYVSMLNLKQELQLFEEEKPIWGKEIEYIMQEIKRLSI
jgi:hypothetical protein